MQEQEKRRRGKFILHRFGLHRKALKAFIDDMTRIDTHLAPLAVLTLRSRLVTERKGFDVETFKLHTRTDIERVFMDYDSYKF